MAGCWKSESQNRNWLVKVMVMMAVLLGCTLSTSGTPIGKREVPLTNPSDAGLCRIHEAIYNDYILRLREYVRSTDSLRQTYPSKLKGSDIYSTDPLLIVEAPAGLDDAKPLDKLWFSVCELEAYEAWLDRTREHLLNNSFHEVADTANCLREFVNAAVRRLREQMSLLENCDDPTAGYSSSYSSSFSSSYATATVPPVQFDRSLLCSAQLTIATPDGNSTDQLWPVVDGMGPAVARLDDRVSPFVDFY